MAQSPGPNKIFNDPIHGSIEMHPYLVRIIDTPGFQRLRLIRQMGAVYFVYPGASHNRFEHSIGVAYLAGELVQALNKQHRLLPNPELKQQDPDLITEEEGLCVQIAALCHDLGHGPFSHLFDDQFIPKVLKKLHGIEHKDPKTKKKIEELESWTHEKQSQMMLDYMIQNMKTQTTGTEDNRFKEFMSEDNIRFIKELIDPPAVTLRDPKKTHKTFLYDIVSNKKNGIDVDKMDYFARDCYHLGIENNFNYRRFMKFARVCVFDDEMQICMRDKEVGNIYDLFHTRNNIHRKACQHKVVKAIETMIVDVLVEADEALGISDSVLEMEKYINMTDDIIRRIPAECAAQEILKRIRERDLYKCVLEIHRADRPDTKTLEDRVAELAKEVEEEAENIDIKIIGMTYGMKGKNPIDQMRFYRKQSPNKAVELQKEDVSRLLPSVFAEQLIHVYCKKPKMTYNENELKDKSYKWLQEELSKMDEANAGLATQKDATTKQADGNAPEGNRE